MSEPPLVDVVIPVFNRAGPVVEAVDSVLAQDGPTFHVHVTDDGSTDGTADAVQAIVDRDPRVTLHRQPNRGVSAARNRAIDACQGRLITFLDSDDLMPEGQLAFQVEHLAGRPDIDAVVGVERIDVAPGVEAPEALVAQIVKTGPKRHWQTVMTARSAIEAIGGYDETLEYGEDLDIAMRLRRNGVRIDYVERVLVVRRITGDNLSYRIRGMEDVLLDLVRSRLDE